MTVTELRQRLEALEREGHGNLETAFDGGYVKIAAAELSEDFAKPDGAPKIVLLS
jgi:hypothetical protein